MVLFYSQVSKKNVLQGENAIWETDWLASQISAKDKRALRDILARAARKGEFAFDPSHPHIPLAVPSYSLDEIMGAVDVLTSFKVTMGERVARFEDKFSSYIGQKHGVMVNSGSSANLLAVSALTSPLHSSSIGEGFEAIVPAVTWATTMFPVNQCNGVPVLADVDGKNFLLTPKSVELAFSNHTRLLVPVHLLGSPCDVGTLTKNLERNSVTVLEDCCEAHGAEIGGHKVGSLGEVSTFSFYFSHHISTVEGGIVLTSNEELAEIVRMLRAHGWTRDLRSKAKYQRLNPGIDPRYLFASPGYNLRPTEIQAAFGLIQLKKLDGIVQARRRNASYLSKRLLEYSDVLTVQTEDKGVTHAWFGYPITVNNVAPFKRDELVRFLEGRGIETRPIMSGNLAEQPAVSLIRHRVSGNLQTARNVMRNSFFFGIHQKLDRTALDYIIDSIGEFLRKRGRVS